MDSDSIIRIYSFLLSQPNYIFDAKKLFNHIKANDDYNRPLYNVLSNQHIVNFNHSNILDGEDKILMKYESAEQIIKRINENKTILNMYDWDNFRGIYIFHHANYTNEFNYTHKDVCELATCLPFMFAETLAMCPCDQGFSNVFWNKFYLCQPIKECKRQNNYSTYQFNKFKLKRYCNLQTDPYHQNFTNFYFAMN